MTDKKEKSPASTRSVVALEDIEGVGKVGELVRLTPARAEALVLAGKVRWSTISDFPGARR